MTMNRHSNREQHHGRARPRRRQRGFSLVELMVAITLGAILLGGAVTLFVNNRETYNVTNDLARLQETARFAMDTIIKDLRMAGYFGCHNRLDAVTNNLPVTTAGQLWDIQTAFPIEGYDSGGAATWQPSGFAVPRGSNPPPNPTQPDQGLLGQVYRPFGNAADPDAITIRYMAGNFSDANANGTPDFQLTNTPIVVDNLWMDVNNNDLLVISDCGRADVFRVNGDAVGNAITPVAAGAYDAGTSPLVGRFVAVRYYIGTTRQSDDPTNTNAALTNAVPALYRETAGYDTATNAFVPNAVGTAGRMALFPGVENMQILYGEDTANSDGVPDQYVVSTAVTDWNDVVAVRIALLVSTPQLYGRSGGAADITNVDRNAYNLLGQVIPAQNDRKRRRVFVTTALLRNLQ